MRTLTNFDEIISQPDHVFGLSMLTGGGGSVGAGATVFFIAQFPFPEGILITEMNVFNSGASGQFSTVSFALGDSVPADDAAFGNLPKMLPQAPFQLGDFASFLVGTDSAFSLSRMRYVVRTNSQRLIIRVLNFGAGTQTVITTFNYLSIPQKIVVP